MQDTARLIRIQDPCVRVFARGRIEVKGKGLMVSPLLVSIILCHSHNCVLQHQQMEMILVHLKILIFINIIDSDHDCSSPILDSPFRSAKTTSDDKCLTPVKYVCPWLYPPLLHLDIKSSFSVPCPSF
jgi:hypothetical protein